MSHLRPARPFARAAAAAALFVGAMGLAACGGANGESGADAGKAGALPEAATVTDADMVIGDPDAPVTIIEFASVTCPGCAAFHARVLPDIKKDWIDTGKARLVFREFPTPPAQLSVIGSVLARCAAENAGGEGYFAVIGSLFQKQAEWVPNGADHKGELLKITQQVGIGEDAFETCLQRQDLVDLIYNNVKSAEAAYQIDSTPSFVVNGEKKSMRSLEDWSKTLEAAYVAATGEQSGAQSETPSGSDAEPASGEES
ncbi:MAG: thioredoxin domain-containing protein [Alphaproteobacteria bacterium]|nr:thioredoxin domain-containing protein [Alphaproteobacteria bacterium]